jgi:hypothetical protein
MRFWLLSTRRRRKPGSQNRWFYRGATVPSALESLQATTKDAEQGRTLMISRLLSAVRRQPLVAFFVLTFALSWEEIGWRGYAVPRLQTGRSALGASLILGTVWGSWQLPMYFTWQAGLLQGLLPLFVVAVVAPSFILTWMHNGTGGPPDGGPVARHAQPPLDAPHRAPREPGHGALLALRRAVGGGGDLGGRLGRAEAPFSQAHKARAGGEPARSGAATPPGAVRPVPA